VNRFALARPASFEAAQAALNDDRFTLPILKAGGIDLLDHLKEGLVEPDALIDIKRLGRAAGRSPISRQGDRIRVEATTTLAEIASSTVLRQSAPALAQAIEDAASPQVRSVATAAGNLLQRPRCWYYRNSKFFCNKKGGGTCFAMEGENRYHAIFHTGPCVIVHPSNLAPALHVLDGTVHVMGGRRKQIPIAELFHMPAEGIFSEHNLEKGELITHITLKPVEFCGFYAIKEKTSFDWPLAMAAAALELDGQTIRSARICAGAVAPIPWHLPEVEKALVGVGLDDDSALRAACERSVERAEPLEHNGYKTKLLPVAVRRAVLRAAGRGENKQ